MRFKVNGNTWHIEFVNPDDTILMRSNGTYSIGVTDNSTKTLSISQELYGCNLWNVICHELCHVWCFELGLHISIETEELLCDFVSTYGRSVVETADMIFGMIRKVA